MEKIFDFGLNLINNSSNIKNLDTEKFKLLIPHQRILSSHVQIKFNHNTRVILDHLEHYRRRKHHHSKYGTSCVASQQLEGVRACCVSG